MAIGAVLAHHKAKLHIETRRALLGLPNAVYLDRAIQLRNSYH
jgi:hypothetical protein